MSKYDRIIELPFEWDALLNLDADRRKLLKLSARVEADTDQIRQQLNEHGEDTVLAKLRELYGGGDGSG